MNKTKVCILTGLVFSLLLAASAEYSSREQRELRMADQAILASLAVSSTPAGRKLCRENELACIGPSKAELGLSLIGRHTTKEGRLALVRLLGYQLDGAVAESYSCFVLNTGPVIKKELLATKPKSLRARCHEELGRLMRSRIASFRDFDESQVCADPDTIATKVKELVDGISKGVKCTAEDF
jgi:hypothetical protein